MGSESAWPSVPLRVSPCHDDGDDDGNGDGDDDVVMMGWA